MLGSPSLGMLIMKKSQNKIFNLPMSKSKHRSQALRSMAKYRFVGLTYQGKDIVSVFRFIIEYSSLKDFDP
jgi:hypothetical protein